MCEKGTEPSYPKSCRNPVHKLDSSASGGRRLLWSPSPVQSLCPGTFVSGSTQHPIADDIQFAMFVSSPNWVFIVLPLSQLTMSIWVKSTYFRDKGSGSHGLTDQTFRPHGLACSPPHFLVVLPASRVVTSLPYIDS